VVRRGDGLAPGRAQARRDRRLRQDPPVCAFVTGRTDGVAVGEAFATGGCSGALALYTCEVA